MGFLNNCYLVFALQICRVEDIINEGIITGSVVHFHWVRTVVVHASGVISASGLGESLCTHKQIEGSMSPSLYVDFDISCEP